MGDKDSYYSHSRPEVVALIPPGTKRLLDVGCGTGAVGVQAKLLGVDEVYGIEFHEGAASKARMVLDGVACGDVESLDIPWGSFDCIVCADVLEHLRDPWATLTRLKQHLSPNGVVIASIPNIAQFKIIVSLLLNRFEYQDEGVLDRTHLRFFTGPSIEQLFLSAGLTVKFMEAAKRQLNWRHKLINLVTFNMLRHCSVSQYLVVAQ